MASDQTGAPGKRMRIRVTTNGPYVVEGDVPLVRKTQISSERGEPLTWEKEGIIPTEEGEYRLCRCGQSSNFPFCDETHNKQNFDGTESGDTSRDVTRAMRFPRGTNIIVKKDFSQCMQSGFCTFTEANLEELVSSTNDPMMRALVIGLIERCPAGALTYRMRGDKPDIEPDLPLQVAVTTETTSSGPIAGPLWVTGGIPVERADGQPFETRNRVTLCNCGKSLKKPLCDGKHRDLEERKAFCRRESGV